jgi:hypothetical protein
MIDKETERLMKENQRFFGLSSTFKTYTPYPFGSIDQVSSRQGMEDKDFYWIENYLRTGNGNLRALWDQGTALFTAPAGKTIVYFFFYYISNNNFAAVFLSDGTAIQINTSTRVQTVISNVPNTFYQGSGFPACGQWGNQYLIIANNNTVNDYWIWDGVTLYTSGSLAPQVVITNSGSGYTSAPTVTAYGGSGTGATFAATVSNGFVTNVTVTNPGSGYQVGESVQVYFTGGGSDNGVALTAVLGSTSVGSVIITSPGSGYADGTYALTFTGGGGGSGAAGTYTALGGVVTSATVTSGGSGYTSTPTVTFTSGGGSGTVGVVSLVAAGISSVTIVSGGTHLTAAPTLTFSGGGGSGATAVASISSGVITSVSVTNAGSGYTSTPAITAQTGLNKAAAATVSLMPFGISGSSVETYQQRVWLPFPHQTGTIINSGKFNVSAPGSVTDFSTSNGGVLYTSTDSFLSYQYTNIKQSNGYLYPIADSSVSVISGVTTSGSPTTTTFSYQNTDPQVGSIWRDAVQAYGRAIILANTLGVYGIYGGAVTKVSQKIDNIFQNALFPPTVGAITPSSATANIYNNKVFLMLMTLQDPFTLMHRNALIGWNEKDWFVASQSIDLKFIGTQKINSSLVAWGTDGNGLFPLFQSPSTSISKIISTKLYGQNAFIIQKQAQGLYLQTQDFSGNGVTFNNITVDAEHGSYSIPNIPFTKNGEPPYYPIDSRQTGDVPGVNLGLTLTSTSADYTINYIGMGYIDISQIAMSSDTIDGNITTE